MITTGTSFTSISHDLLQKMIHVAKKNKTGIPHEQVNKLTDKKRKQKQAVVLRSNSGGQHICDALTIIETAKMQNKNIYDVVEVAFIK